VHDAVGDKRLRFDAEVSGRLRRKAADGRARIYNQADRIAIYLRIDQGLTLDEGDRQIKQRRELTGCDGGRCERQEESRGPVA
jgi:hypothetical protein